MNGIERARLNILQALDDLSAHHEQGAADTKEVDDIVGDLSRYAHRSNHKVVQSLMRDKLVILVETPTLKLYLTPQGQSYLKTHSG